MQVYSAVGSKKQHAAAAAVDLWLHMLLLKKNKDYARVWVCLAPTVRFYAWHVQHLDYVYHIVLTVVSSLIKSKRVVNTKTMITRIRKNTIVWWM